MEEKGKKEVKRKLPAAVVKSKVKEKTGFEVWVSNFIDGVVIGKVVPAAKNMAVDFGIDFLESVFFGQATGRYRSNRYTYDRGDYPRVSYSSRYGSSNSRYNYHDDRMERDSRFRYDFTRLQNDDGSAYDRGQIEKIISSMQELIDHYGEASVADLFSICGVSPNPVDNYWGWRDCRDFGKRPYRDGYILDFAEPIDIR